MNNISILTKLFFKSNFSLKSSKSNSKVRKIIIAIMIILGAYAVFSSIGKGVSIVYPMLKSIGAEEMLISLSLRAVSIFLFIYSTISVLSYFYSSEDMDLLLPLPVKPYEIISAKFIVTTVNQYILGGIILIPLFLFYGISSHASIMYYLNAVLVVLASPILPLIFNLILMMFLMSFSGLAKNKEKFKSLMLGLVMILGFGYRFFQSYLNDTFGNIENLNNIASVYNNWSFVKITNIFYTIRFQTDALLYSGTYKGFMGLLIFLILTIISYLFLAFIAEKTYLKGIVGSGSIFSKRKTLTEQGLNEQVIESSILKACFLKEVRMLFRTSAFALNCIFSNLIISVVIIISIGKGIFSLSKVEIGKVITLDSPITIYMIVAILAVIILITSLNNISSTSITREGKNAHILKYLPIDYKTQIFAKALVAEMFNSIYLVIFIVIAFIIGISPLIILLISILILLISIFISLTGVVIDLNRPKLTWDNETQAVKQNFNPYINFILNAVIGSFMYLLTIAMLPTILTCVIVFVVYTILIILIFQYINKNANKLFKRIN